MRRILRIELRRSTAPWLVVLVALGIAGVGLWLPTTGDVPAGTGAWYEQWQGLAQNERFLLFFTWPVVVGLGAWQGTRQRRSTMDELVATVPRPGWQRWASLTGAVSIALTVGYAVVFLAGAVLVVAHTDYFHLGWVPTFLVGVLSLIAGSLLGQGIGHLLPYLVTPIVVTATAFGTLYVPAALVSGSTTTDPVRGTDYLVSLLSPILPEAPTAYTTIADAVSFGQALWFLGIAGTGFLLLVLRRRLRVLAVLPTALALGLALAILPDSPALARPYDRAAYQPVCDTNGPTVCVTRAHAALLEKMTGPARWALRKLAKLPNVPTSVREIPDEGFIGASPKPFPTTPRPADTVLVDLNDGYELSYDGDIDPEQMRLHLLAGAGTPACGSDSSAPIIDPRLDAPGFSDEILVRLVLAAWFTGELRGLPADPPLLIGYPVNEDTTKLWRALRAQPMAEQQRRVVAARQAFLSCTGDPYETLLHGAR